MSSNNGTDLSNEQIQEISKKRKPKNGLEIMKDFGVDPGENAKFIRFALTAWDAVMQKQHQLKGATNHA